MCRKKGCVCIHTNKFLTEIWMSLETIQEGEMKVLDFTSQANPPVFIQILWPFKDRKILIAPHLLKGKK